MMTYAFAWMPTQPYLLWPISLSAANIYKTKSLRAPAKTKTSGTESSHDCDCLRISMHSFSVPFFFMLSIYVYFLFRINLSEHNYAFMMQLL